MRFLFIGAETEYQTSCAPFVPHEMCAHVEQTHTANTHTHTHTPAPHGRHTTHHSTPLTTPLTTTTPHTTSPPPQSHPPTHTPHTSHHTHHHTHHHTRTHHTQTHLIHTPHHAPHTHTTHHTQHPFTYMTPEHYFCCAQCNIVTLGRRLPIQPSAVGRQVPDVAIPHYRDARMQHSQRRQPALPGVTTALAPRALPASTNEVFPASPT